MINVFQNVFQNTFKRIFATHDVQSFALIQRDGNNIVDRDGATIVNEPRT